MYDILVILVCLGTLIALAYRGGNMLILAPLMATLAVVLSGSGAILASYTQIFMTSTGKFIISFFPLFLLGAVFGKLMDATGSAQVLAQGIIGRLGVERAILAVILSCAAMTYGGVSLFVVAFAVYPIAARLFWQADLPKKLMPAAIALGSFTFTMTALPGSPAIQNAIPMPHFGTTPFAAPGLGLIAAVIMFTAGWQWLEYRARQLGPGYGAVPEAAAGPQAEGPTLFWAALPLILVLVLNALFTWVIIPLMDTSYLATPEFGNTTVEEVRGVWSVIAALTLAIFVLIGINFNHLKAMNKAVDQGANDSLQPIFNTASLVGFGSVVASLAGFLLISDWVLTLGGDNPLISLALSASLLAGLTGSASGGMSIALNTLGDTYMQMAEVAGISPQLLHRVTVLATGSLDTLPHNGAVITLLSICGLKHREAYGDLAIVGIVFPVCALIVVITLGTIFGSF